MQHKEASGIVKSSTLTRYRGMTDRIYPTLGKKKLKDIKPQTLNELYDFLLKCGKQIEASALAKKKFVTLYKKSGFSFERFHRATGVSVGTISDAVHGKPIRESKATALSRALGFDVKDLFTLSYRRAIGYIMVYSGGRRGEILGLEWKNINFEKGVIRFEKNVLYVQGRGIYEDTLKTEMSERTISIPQSALAVLAEYKEQWYDKVKGLAGDEWEDNGFVFVTEYGKHPNPTTISTWLRRVEEKYGLPHLNAHAFRHSVASALIFAGVDPVSVAHRLGHNQVSTTTNIYAHIMSKADERTAEILGELF